MKELDTDAADGAVMEASDSGERSLTFGRVVKGWMYGIENGCEYDVGRKGNSDGGRDVPLMGSSRICVIIIAGKCFLEGDWQTEDQQLRDVAVRGEELSRNGATQLQSRDVGMWKYRRRTERSL